MPSATQGSELQTSGRRGRLSRTPSGYGARRSRDRNRARWDSDTDHVEDRHTREPVEPGSSLTGYAAIKYTAIVVIVLSILAFLAWYVLPRF